MVEVTNRKPMVLWLLLIFTVCGLITAGIVVDGFTRAVGGFFELQMLPARLISDYVEMRGIGAALINGALVGAVGMILVAATGVQISGPTYAAVFTMIGFGFFGKTPLNIAPILLGVYAAARLVGKRMQEYVLIGLFGTALGPMVSFVVCELGFSGLGGIAAGFAVGIATGFFLPAVAVAMLHLHQGYNLYNLGLSCGFFGLFLASLARASGAAIDARLEWYSGGSTTLALLVPVLSLVLVAAGLAMGGGGVLKSFWEIQKLSGRLPSDFMGLASVEGALANSGLLGLLGAGYVFAVGGDFNGPVLGGLFTVMGFGAFGTHLKNSWPVVIGVIASTFLFGESLAAPGPVLAAIFVTTVAPLAGQFGMLVGFAAGFVHFIMVSQTGPWHGGMNLYNNGFAGGLTATLFVAVLQWYETNRPDTD